jgi:hypothetical protein
MCIESELGSWDNKFRVVIKDSGTSSYVMYLPACSFLPF